jgi:hypothetical protein
MVGLYPGVESCPCPECEDPAPEPKELYPDGGLHPAPVELRPVFNMFEVFTPNNGKGDI